MKITPQNNTILIELDNDEVAGEISVKNMNAYDKKTVQIWINIEKT